MPSEAAVSSPRLGTAVRVQRGGGMCGAPDAGQPLNRSITPEYPCSTGTAAKELGTAGSPASNHGRCCRPRRPSSGCKVRRQVSWSCPTCTETTTHVMIMPCMQTDNDRCHDRAPHAKIEATTYRSPTSCVSSALWSALLPAAGEGSPGGAVRAACKGGFRVRGSRDAGSRVCALNMSALAKQAGNTNQTPRLATFGHVVSTKTAQKALALRGRAGSWREWMSGCEGKFAILKPENESHW